MNAEYSTVGAEDILLLRAYIEREANDIAYVLHELKRYDWPIPDICSDATRPRKGRRASNPTTLQAQLTKLQALRAWLHASLIESRGDRPFSQGVEADGVLIAAPTFPGPAEARPRGRPRGRMADKRLVYFVDLVRALAAASGKTVTLVQILDGLSGAKGFPSVIEPSDYRKARRRLKAAELPSK